MPCLTAAAPKWRLDPVQEADAKAEAEKARNAQLFEEERRRTINMESEHQQKV